MTDEEISDNKYNVHMFDFFLCKGNFLRERFQHVIRKIYLFLKHSMKHKLHILINIASQEHMYNSNMQ